MSKDQFEPHLNNSWWEVKQTLDFRTLTDMRSISTNKKTFENPPIVKNVSVKLPVYTISYLQKILDQGYYLSFSELFRSYIRTDVQSTEQFPILHAYKKRIAGQELYTLHAKLPIQLYHALRDKIDAVKQVTRTPVRQMTYLRSLLYHYLAIPREDL